MVPPVALESEPRFLLKFYCVQVGRISKLFLDHQDAAPHDLLTLLHGEEGSGSFLKNQESRWLIEIGYCVAAGVLLEKLDNAIIGEFVLFNDMLSLYQTDPNEEIFNKN